MESASDEATDSQTPTRAEIAAHLERATRSLLASSPLASYSHADAPSRTHLLSELPSLGDLLAHVGPPDCLRCPSCRAPLPLGSYSRLCLSCDAAFVEIPPPTLNSTIAFRRFSESLGLEIDFGGAEEEHFPGQEGSDILIKSSASSSFASGEPGVQKGLLRVSASSHQENSLTEAIATESLIKTSISSDVSSVSQVESESTTHKQYSVLDYSSKLEGISLEDFFSNQSRQEIATLKTDIVPSNSSEMVKNMDTSGINVQKQSLFWDPFSDIIIPDGSDIKASTKNLTVNDIKMEVEEDDDPFSSWDGDFQSAPPAMNGTSISYTSEAQSFIQGDLEEFFANAATTKERDGGKSGGLQGDHGLANRSFSFGSIMDTSLASHVDANDLLLGSEWEQSVQPSAITLAANGCQSTTYVDEEDMFGAFSSSPAQILPTSDGSFNPENSVVTETDPQAPQADGRTNKMLESLLAQMHDLSFMLADKLVIKSEGKNC